MSEDPIFLQLVNAAATALKERADEVNKLNVFPVPDGDTGTNMSLTMDAVIAELSTLPHDATVATVCKTITHGSLMGARGNSGVILSQIIRGLCDEIIEAEMFDIELVARALDRSRDVAFQAVRKPVAGTMLTVLEDAAAYARTAVDEEMPLDELLDGTVRETFASVTRTTDLLPVLKENDVVDAGAYGLAILAEGMLAAYHGHPIDVGEIRTGGEPEMAEFPEDDWDDEEYLYCTEFLLHGDSLDRSAINEFITSAGGSELVVGDESMLKIHVHTDDPQAVLDHVLQIGEVSEVHINNMRLQTAARSTALREDAEAASASPMGVVTVAVGDGTKTILESLGADLVVSGGQTMNPSTQQLVEAARSIHCEQVIILPNNKNIQLAAEQAADACDFPIGVVPTRSVPEAFSALLVYDPETPLEENLEAMTEAASAVRTGEVTTAIKDSKAKFGDIQEGQVIGIADHEIEVAGENVLDVSLELAALLVDGAETLTVLAGEELEDDDLEVLTARLSEAHPMLDVEAHRGGQPLYPVIMAAE
jgi:DAK2 domain fusion protein YloV